MESGRSGIAIVDVAMKHSHVLIVSLYLLQLLIKVVLLAIGNKIALGKFTKGMKIPHIILATLMMGTGVYLMVRMGPMAYTELKFALVLASIPVGIIGSKRQSLPMLALSFLILCGVMTLAYTKPTLWKSGKVVEGSDSVKAGQVVYQENCQRCHGADGLGGFAGAKDLTKSTMADAEITNVIVQGNASGTMPAHPNLSAQQVEQVKEFVKQLRK
jgi:uncharacterized membrane protein SirB2